jgi:hypothetical protein
MPTPLHRGALWLSPTRKRTEPDELSYAPSGNTPRGDATSYCTDTADQSFIGGYRWQRSGLAVGSPGRNGGGGGCSRVSSR